MRAATTGSSANNTTPTRRSSSNIRVGNRTQFHWHPSMTDVNESRSPPSQPRSHPDSRSPETHRATAPAGTYESAWGAGPLGRRQPGLGSARWMFALSVDLLDPECIGANPVDLLEVQRAPLPPPWCVHTGLHQRSPRLEHADTDLERLRLADGVVDDVDRTGIRHRKALQRLPQPAAAPRGEF